MEDTKINISIIFPMYNGEDVINNNLESIQALLNLNEIELIVIDNNSNDSSRDLIKLFKNIRINLIENNQNLGFAKACNIGVKFAKGEFIFITNQDVIFPKDFFKITMGLYKKLEISDGKDLILCPAIVFTDKRINYFGAKIHFLGFSYTPNMYQKIPARKLTFKTQKISGSSMFLKKKKYLELNGFDPFFFMYQEDSDLSLKAIRKRVNVYTTNETMLIHQKSHFELNDFTYFYIERNRYLCLIKNLKDLKKLFPFAILSEFILIIQAILIKKIKTRFKIYKFLIQNFKQIRDLRKSSTYSNSPKINKHQLSTGLDLILFKDMKGNNKLFKFFLKIINIVF